MAPSHGVYIEWQKNCEEGMDILFDRLSEGERLHAMRNFIFGGNLNSSYSNYYYLDFFFRLSVFTSETSGKTEFNFGEQYEKN